MISQSLRVMSYRENPHSAQEPPTHSSGAANPGVRRPLSDEEVQTWSLQGSPVTLPLLGHYVSIFQCRRSHRDRGCPSRTSPPDPSPLQLPHLCHAHKALPSCVCLCVCQGHLQGILLSRVCNFHRHPQYFFLIAKPKGLATFSFFIKFNFFLSKSRKGSYDKEEDKCCFCLYVDAHDFKCFRQPWIFDSQFMTDLHWEEGTRRLQEVAAGPWADREEWTWQSLSQQSQGLNGQTCLIGQSSGCKTVDSKDPFLRLCKFDVIWKKSPCGCS